ncbi:LcrG family type III secretion system chaperone PcrG [Pseudomonas aeruginosa]|uniref:LcrG family type III secretion system chaperone PcrG n=1 Tax=Pseudomonas aeruginosa TaxID=287 RepID=UPI000F7A0D5B|nr:LcrG family type III secretion system chaperone PcrG [Pseudomonas aeruginosa]RRX03375.1 type III secretion protein LcrG [Pseudomonas aeruginosa]
MGDMNEYTEDTLRATVQAAELAIRDSEERGRLLAEMWHGLGLAADAGALLFQAPERELARAAEEELLADLRRMRSSQPTQGEQGTRPRRPTPMRGLLI